MALLTTLLTGCQAIHQKLYETAIKVERARIGLKESKVTAGNIEYSLLRGGRAGTQTILMVHGFGAEKHNWLQLAAELRKDYQIIAVDLAGHGESSLETNIHGQPLDYLIPSQSERLHDLLNTLNIDKVHLMGNSMGGAIGLLFAASYPKRLHSLTLLDNAGIETPQPSEFFQRLEKGENPLIVRKSGDFDRLIEFVVNEKPSMLWTIAPVLERRTIARAKINDKIFADMLKSRELIGSPKQMAALMASLTTPVLVIWGEKDRVIHISSIEVMRRHIPNMESIILPNVGHVPMMEAPEEVSKAFRKFTENL